MDDLSDSSATQRVVVMKSTQVGLTEVGLNWIGYHIARGLGPMLVVVPTLEVRKRWVLQRLHPMLADTDVLRALSTRRTRDSANAEDLKDFPEALLVLSGANSTSSLQSMPIRHVICDEVDDFPWQLGGDGDPLGLIQRRTANQPRRKVLLISRPTIRGASRIEEEYHASDQRRYLVPCPECGHYQPLVWSNLIWDKALTSARYACAECGIEFGESNKPAMLAAGRWVAQEPNRPTHGYHINGLYAPIGLGLSWLELARDWVAAQTDPTKLRRFINTALGEAWEDRSREIKAHRLIERAEPYQLRQVPPGCLVVTAGVDTQDDRLAVVLVGWGDNDVAWILDWVQFFGNPGRSELWAELTAFLNMPVVNSYGREVKISAAAIDSGGHYTHEVYSYCRTHHQRKNVIPIKGANTPGKPILGRPTAVDITIRGRSHRRGVKLYPVGTDTAKHALASRLRADEDQAPEDRRLRFSEQLESDFYDQLTAEIFDPVRNKWVVRKGRRNEALDCFVYASAAAHHPAVRVHAKRPRDWANLAKILEADNAEAAEAAPDPVKRKRRNNLPTGVNRR